MKKSIQQLLKDYPQFVSLKHNTPWSFWAKKFSEIHLPAPNCCPVPKLGNNNYAQYAIEENRNVCPECLKIFFNNIPLKEIRLDDAMTLHLDEQEIPEEDNRMPYGTATKIMAPPEDEEISQQEMCDSMGIGPEFDQEEDDDQSDNGGRHF